MRVLLHACCGPCLIEPYDALAAEHEVAVCYANPNIHPLGEYVLRRDTFVGYAREVGAEVIEEPYRPSAWMHAVSGLEDDPSARCRACFRLRIGLVAQLAAERGYEAVATTLTVSPYQDQSAIREAGEAACAEVGVEFLETDYRDRYPAATRRSRELGMYRQRYCGCLLSEIEADAEREARRAARKSR